MKKTILFFLAAILVLFSITHSTFSAGIPGATDKVPAATLLVPFFEVGIGSPQDTLLVVNSIEATTDVIIHYEVWDIDGNLAALQGNVTLGPHETWSASMADLISGASAATKTQLTDGSFYHGFVTIDVVTTSTSEAPTSSGYPFSNYSSLNGYTYYVRLLEGSSNGLTMLPIQVVRSTADVYLRNFYRNNDRREKIDSDARYCAQNILESGATSCGPSEYIYEIYSRVFLDPSMSGGSRIIVFAWDPERIGGPSVYCNTSGLCDTTYIYQRYDEAGNLEENTTISLDHAVNVIDVTGTENGWVSIYQVPSTVGPTHFQIFAFSFNSASSSSVSTNWDAIFESYIHP